MKITFKETNAALTYEINGDININPKFVDEFGIIEGTNLNPVGFVFDPKGNIGVEVKK
jgi:hypothetical protein